MGKGNSSGIHKVTFGAEWGYSAVLASGYHYNFFDPDGFRVDSKDFKFSHFNNGEVSFHIGYNFNRYWNLSIYAGYIGAGDYQPVLPFSLRATRFFGDSHISDRWFAFWDLGSGICLKEKPQEIITTKIGGGYRYSLSRHTKLDMLLGLRFLYTHPDIIHYGEKVSQTWINRNDGYICSLNIGISLTF